MDLPHLHGIVPPLPTPLKADESIDRSALRLVEFHQGRGPRPLDPGDDRPVRPDPRRAGAPGRRGRPPRPPAGGVPLVLNVSDQGTAPDPGPGRAMFDDLPYDYYAALPPWYQPMTAGRGGRLLPRPGRPARPAAGHLQRPLGLQPAHASTTSASWPSTRGSSAARTSTPSLSRTLDWPAAERRGVGLQLPARQRPAGHLDRAGGRRLRLRPGRTRSPSWPSRSGTRPEPTTPSGPSGSSRSSPGWPGRPASGRCSPAWRSPAGTGACSSGCSPPRSARSTPRPPGGWSRWSRPSASCPMLATTARPETRSRIGSWKSGGDTSPRFVKVRHRSPDGLDGDRRRDPDDGPTRSIRARRGRGGPAASRGTLTEEHRAWRLITSPGAAGAAAWLDPLAVALPAPGRRLAPDGELRGRGPDAPRSPGRSAEHAEACRKAIATAVARARAARLAHPCPIRVKLTGGEAGGLTSFGFAGGRVSDQEMTRRGPARPDPRLGPAPRGHPHDLRRLLRRPDAPMGRRGGVAPERGPPRAAAPRPDRRRPARPAGRPAARPPLPDRGVPQRPDGLLRPGLLDLAVPVEMGGRPRFLKFVRDGSRTGWDAADPDPLRPGRRPRARPRLAVLAQGRRPRPSRRATTGRPAQSAE